MAFVCIDPLKPKTQQRRRERQRNAAMEVIRFLKTGAGRVHITAGWRNGCEIAFSIQSNSANRIDVTNALPGPIVAGGT